ncbi:hypothetical protein HYE30_00870 [Mycoplasmopsis bovis]|nr:hypothetical protein [Mycoplasmopsis bovis]QQH22451.1 hypothetical protein HYE30_00870 [Mycoplasmopsis bovis]
MDKIIIKEYKQETNVKFLSIKEMKSYKYCCWKHWWRTFNINEKNITTLEYIADTTKLVVS